MLLDWQTFDGLAWAVALAGGTAETVSGMNRLDSSFYGTHKYAARANSDTETALAAELLIKGVNKTWHPLKAPESAIDLC